MTSSNDKQQQNKSRQQGSDPQQGSTQGRSSQMQGEGNYDAAREYDDDQRRFVESGKVDAAARAAKPRSETEEEEMLEADRTGRVAPRKRTRQSRDRGAVARSRNALDVIIVGAGPAGLSAALILGRCCRRVLVFDTGIYRNAASHALHGYLTRDGIAPLDFLQLARDQLVPYDTVRIEQDEVVDARCVDDLFAVTLRDSRIVHGRKLLIATGVVDSLPPWPGIDLLYGRSVFHCPYCDGWEVRGRALAVYGKGERGKGLALELTLWSSDVVLCTDGPSELDEQDRTRLAKHHVALYEDAIDRLEGKNGLLQRIVFKNGNSIARRALFFNTGKHQASGLAAKLGCTFDDKGEVLTGRYESTGIPGLFVAGDVSRSVHLVVVAAAEGAEAAFAINTALLKEDLAREEA